MQSINTSHYKYRNHDFSKLINNKIFADLFLQIDKQKIQQYLLIYFCFL